MSSMFGKDADPVAGGVFGPPARAASWDRYERRWHLVEVGVSNVWKYTSAEVFAMPSGRLMWRASNGIGKTTALEMSPPFLLDLITDPAKLSVGTGRHTRVETWMRLGADASTRRVGYLWVTFEGPHAGAGQGEQQSYGVRIEFTANAGRPVELVPFRLPGVAVAELMLHGEGGDEVPREDFSQQVAQAGGQVFPDADAYRQDLARRLFGSTVRQLTDLCNLIRRVRDPRLLQATSAGDAEKVLRDALPRVSESTVAAASQALTDTSSARVRYERRHRTAELTAALARHWRGHCASLVGDLLGTLEQRIAARTRSQAAFKTAAEQRTCALEERQVARGHLEACRESHLACEAAERVAGDKALQSNAQIADTQQRLRTCSELVDAQASALRAAVETDRMRQSSLLGLARALGGDVNSLVATAHAADPELLLAEQPVVAREIARADLRFGDGVLPQGAAADIHADPAGIERMGVTVREAAERQVQLAARAEIILDDHEQVTGAGATARAARQFANSQADQAEEDRKKRDAALCAASTAADAHTDAIMAWAAALPGLGLHPRPGSRDEAREGEGLFTADAMRQWAARVVGTEPAAVLACAAELAREAGTVSKRLQERAQRRAAHHQSSARRLRRQAADAGQEALAYANGQLPAFPVPHWAPPADDRSAFGAALTWACGAPEPGPERDLLEAAIAATGLLGAALGSTSLQASALDDLPLQAAGSWRIDLNGTGDSVTCGLDQVLAPLPGDPRAEAVLAVLGRIALADTAGDVAGSALVIGRDGTYRAGPTRARVPGADDLASLERAHHIGLDNRRAEAGRRARSARLRADGLNRRAERHQRVQALLDARAAALAAAVSAFPDDGVLHDAENAHATAALIADASHRKAAKADNEAQVAEAAHRTCLERWRARAEAEGLPGDVDRLRRAQSRSREAAAILRGVAESLGGLSGKVSDLADLADQAARAAAEGPADHEEAVLALQEHIARRHTLQAGLTAQLEARDATARGIHLSHGAIVEALKEAAESLRRAVTLEQRAEQDVRDSERALAVAEAALTGQEEIDTALVGLRATLAAKGVADALGVDAGLPAEQLRAEVAARLAGLSHSSGAEVHEAAELLAVHLRDQDGEDDWRLEWAHEDSPGGILPVRLARPGAAYAPPKAADLAAAASSSAEEELNAAEHKTLDDLAVGLIPDAIGAAWQDLKEWIRRTNELMSLAAASSGVGVQIRHKLRSSLSPGMLRIHELTCKESRASRTPEQEAEVRAEILAQLRLSDDHVRASSTDTIERLKAIVDITSWIDLSYMVNKPGQSPAKLTDRKTSVSGGERRLVILAPMLAALAAEHDKLHPAAPRLVALDEVPAEVDTAGKDALARYISHLDLDLLCTSHGWDGSPASWDGIDIYALEKLPDGTVTSSPMHLRDNRLAQALEEILLAAAASS
ncbi:SbcC/MukB-like Walker B domain-containing protein [Kitasatospora sp. NPDC057542]|uniref:SbcC/MukB-like Walker B domain-containing protein n=1 Tax=Kitasatospora sp. NPDC057542 TaxID=3346162 RepID=UPI00369EA4C7